MAEHQRPYVPAKTLSTEYPVSLLRDFVVKSVLSPIQSSSTVIRTYLTHCRFI